MCTSLISLHKRPANEAMFFLFQSFGCYVLSRQLPLAKGVTLCRTLELIDFTLLPVAAKDFLKDHVPQVIFDYDRLWLSYAKVVANGQGFAAFQAPGRQQRRYIKQYCV